MTLNSIRVQMGPNWAVQIVTVLRDMRQSDVIRLDDGFWDTRERFGDDYATTRLCAGTNARQAMVAQTFR